MNIEKEYEILMSESDLDPMSWVISAGTVMGNMLAEVKRLRGIIDYIRDTGRMEKACFPNIPSGHLLSIMEKVLTTEEYLEWRNQND